MVECVQLRKAKLGMGHPNTISSINVLGKWTEST
jgi:hypothetical protein